MDREDNGDEGDVGISGDDVALAESIIELELFSHMVVSIKSFDFRARQLFLGKK